MKKSMIIPAAFGVVCLLILTVSARTAEPAKTTISVSDLECMGCAKKCAGELYAIAGVAKVEANVEGKTLTITPKAGSALSPRSLWEAVEKAGKTPAKIQGPSGTYVAKPKS